MIFDSHAHFTSINGEGEAPAFDVVDITAQLDRARAAGLCGVLACGGGPDLDDGAIAAVRAAPDFAFLALGLGRDTASVTAATPAALRASIATLKARIAKLESEGIKISAIGEIGLDFSHDETASERDAQIALFAEQLQLAAEMNVPCTIHSRDAADETIKTLQTCAANSSVIHCFTGSADFAAAVLELGLSIGVSGIATFRNADALRGIVRTLPRARVVLETDCPWLAPVPLRGRANEPAFISHTCNLVASLWEISPEECAAICTENAMRLFTKSRLNAIIMGWGQ